MTRPTLFTFYFLLPAKKVWLASLDSNQAALMSASIFRNQLSSGFELVKI